MSLFDRFRNPPPAPASPPAPATSPDEQAIARYRYMLRTAPPEAIERAHAEVFASLTPEQRRKVLEQLSADAPAAERDNTPAVTDPQMLARYATRAEIRQPGALERALGTVPTAGGTGFGRVLAGSLLGSMAGSVLGTAIAQHFLASHGVPESGALDPAQFGDLSPLDAPTQDPTADATDGGFDDGGDFGGDTFDV